MLMGVATGVRRYSTVSDTPLIRLSSVNRSAQVTAGNDEVVMRRKIVTIDKHCFVPFSARPTTAVGSTAKISIKIKLIITMIPSVVLSTSAQVRITSSNLIYSQYPVRLGGLLPFGGVVRRCNNLERGCVRVIGPPF